MSELKPCPFCGGKAKTMAMEQHRWWVFCSECMCDLGFEGMDESGCYGHFDTEAEAVEAWNTRHVETDALREACMELVTYAGTCPFDAKDADTASWTERCERECSTDVDMAACWMRYFMEVER